MAKRTIWLAAAVVVALVQTTCGGDDAVENCTAAALTAALEAAQPGDTVRVGACRIEGSFTVPAGVSLVGRGRDLSILVTSVPQPALRVTGGSPATRVADLAVESAGNSGILLRGSGEATLEHVFVRATRRIALGAEELSVLTMDDVLLEGPVTSANANSIIPSGDPPVVDSDAWPTHGLVAVGIDRVDLTDVTATGFASMGVLLVDCTTTWTGGGAPANLGTGLMVYGGSATLDNLDLSRMLKGFLLMPSYGGVFAGGADVLSTSLRASDGGNYGLLHDDATARHLDLVARSNGDAAVWLQHCDGVELSGGGMEIAENRLAGVVAVESSNITLADGRIDDTALATRIFGETGAVQVGDGVQIVRAAGPTTLRSLALSGNERVGLLVDLGGDPMEGLTIEGVVVDGFGTQLGAIAQGGTVPDGWDDGVDRHGDTASNDALPRSRLSVVGTIGGGDMPAADNISRDGLRGLGDPDPPP